MQNYLTMSIKYKQVLYHTAAHSLAEANMYLGNSQLTAKCLLKQAKIVQARTVRSIKSLWSFLSNGKIMFISV